MAMISRFPQYSRKTSKFHVWICCCLSSRWDHWTYTNTQSNDFEQRKLSTTNGLNLTDCSRFHTIYKINLQVAFIVAACDT